jgi:hypothetical protein
MNRADGGHMTQRSSRYRLFAVILAIAFSIGISLVLYESSRPLQASLSDLTREYNDAKSAAVAMSIFRVSGACDTIRLMVHAGWAFAFLLALGLFIFDDMPRTARALPLAGVVLLYLVMLLTLPLS